MSSEVIRLTAKFKLKEAPKGLDNLFSTYREIVNFLIAYAHENNITSFYRLKSETYPCARYVGETKLEWAQDPKMRELRSRGR